MTSRRTILLFASALLAGCIPRSRPRADACELDDGFGPAGTVAVRAVVVADGLVVPWGLGFLPGGRDLLVTERPGRVRLVRDGKLVETPVAVVDVSKGSESGLLGIAIDPRFATNRFFYLYATVDVPNFTVSRVMRYRLSENGLEATRDAILVDGIRSAVFHDGGRLKFGPDGMLYAGTGDARRPKSAQKVAGLSGKILRLSPDGGIPKDNPWPGKAAFLRGIRNTQGFDWLPDGRMVVTDHGPTGLEWGIEGHDELSIAKGGDNLGWPRIYGCGKKRGMVSPSLVWKKAVPPGGAAIYTGDAIPAWRGSMLIGTLRSKHLQRVLLDPQTGAVTGHEVYFQGAFGRLRDVTMGPDGHLYVTTSNCDGRGSCPPGKDQILRIVPE